MKKGALIFLTLILGLMMFFLTACGNKNGPNLPELPDKCDTIEGPSMLCDMAHENGVNLTVLADGLGLGMIAGIKFDLYTRDEITKILIDLRRFMENPVSYAAFKLKINDIITEYPMLLDTVDDYVDLLVSSQIMYKEDQRLIRERLDRMILGLQPRGQPA